MIGQTGTLLWVPFLIVLCPSASFPLSIWLPKFLLTPNLGVFVACNGHSTLESTGPQSSSVTPTMMTFKVQFK